MMLLELVQRCLQAVTQTSSQGRGLEGPENLDPIEGDLASCGPASNRLVKVILGRCTQQLQAIRQDRRSLGYRGIVDDDHDDDAEVTMEPQAVEDPSFSLRHDLSPSHANNHDLLLSDTNAKVKTLVSLCDEKFKSYPYREIPRCWRRLYTDAIILKACFSIILSLDQVEASVHSNCKGGKLRAEDWLGLIKDLDLVLIVPGCPGQGRKEMVYDLIRACQHCLAISETQPLKGGASLRRADRGSVGQRPLTTTSLASQFDDTICSSEQHEFQSTSAARIKSFIYHPSMEEFLTPLPKLPDRRGENGARCRELVDYGPDDLANYQKPFILRGYAKDWPALEPFVGDGPMINPEGGSDPEADGQDQVTLPLPSSQNGSGLDERTCGKRKAAARTPHASVKRQKVPGEISPPSKWSSGEYLKRITGRGRHVPVEVGSNYTEQGWGQAIMPWEEFLDRSGWSDGWGSCGGHDDEEEGEGEGEGGGGGGGGGGAEATFAESERSSRRTLYLAQHSLLNQFPQLSKDMMLPDFVFSCPPPPDPNEFPDYRPPVDEESGSEDVVVNAWLGPGGTVSPPHTDPYYNCFVQVVGYKEVWISPPDSNKNGAMASFGGGGGGSQGKKKGHGLTDSLGVGDDDQEGSDLDNEEEGGINRYMCNTSSVDVFQIRTPTRAEDEEGGSWSSKGKDFLEKVLPRSRNYILGPGDLLFLPPGWWHSMRSCTM
ncbi:Clavaminate synthase-like protein, partial [Violaceomyces palustris]